MAKLKITNEWWTAPAEGENGELVLVTGRRDIDNVMASGVFNDRVEVTWKYKPEKNGMPDFKTSSLMEEVQDALEDAFAKDPVAVLTGVYTGAGERNWIFYTRSVNIFGKKLNEALASFELLPIGLYAEKDPEWNEYKEMKLAEVSAED